MRKDVFQKKDFRKFSPKNRGVRVLSADINRKIRGGRKVELYLDIGRGGDLAMKRVVDRGGG